MSRIQAFSQFHSIPLSLSLIQKVLGELIVQSKKTLKTEDILTAIVDFYGVSLEDLVKKGRKKEVAHPRQVAMFLLRSELNSPLSSIGNIFGGRDHTTVLHAVDKITKEQLTNLRLKEELLSLKERLQV